MRGSTLNVSIKAGRRYFVERSCTRATTACLFRSAPPHPPPSLVLRIKKNMKTLIPRRTSAFAHVGTGLQSPRFLLVLQVFKAGDREGVRGWGWGWGGSVQPHRIIPGPFASPSFRGNMWPSLAKANIWQYPEKAITSSGIWRNKQSPVQRVGPAPSLRTRSEKTTT